MKHVIVILIIGFSVLSFTSKPKVNWLTFEALETALTKEPKKVIIHFYADWCTYCKKMEEAAYSKPEVIEVLESDYYVIKFNVESKDTIRFGGKDFVNQNIGKKRTAYHQIPELLAGRQNKELELPATVILDENFNIVERYYRYISPKEMLTILEK